MEIVCNSLIRNDLLAGLGGFSYYQRVTDDEFWVAVGERLSTLRRKRGVTKVAIKETGGPTNKTSQGIEEGRVRQLSKLRDYADKTGISLVDVFRAVLAPDREEQDVTLQYIIREFKNGDAKERQVIFLAAQRVEETRVLRGRAERADQLASKRETPPSKSATAKRREKK